MKKFATLVFFLFLVVDKVSYAQESFMWEKEYREFLRNRGQTAVEACKDTGQMSQCGTQLIRRYHADLISRKVQPEKSCEDLALYKYGATPEFRMEASINPRNELSEFGGVVELLQNGSVIIGRPTKSRKQFAEIIINGETTIYGDVSTNNVLVGFGTYKRNRELSTTTGVKTIPVFAAECVEGIKLKR